MTSRLSAEVSEISAIHIPRAAQASARTNSAPTRVLPQPRPVRISQPSQPPAGGNCSGRAQKSHSHSRLPHSSSVSSLASLLTLFAGSDSIQLCPHFFTNTRHLPYGVLCRVARVRGPVAAAQNLLQQFHERRHARPTRLFLEGQFAERREGFFRIGFLRRTPQREGLFDEFRF